MTHLKHHVFWLIYMGLFALIFCPLVNAQRGTAPNNYYPTWYNGATFTGQVVGATGDTITLAYTHGNKTETFEGRATAPCNLPSSKTSTDPKPFTSLPTGSMITAFYEPKTVRVNGQKQKENQVMAISFIEVNGRKVQEEHRAIFYCIPGTFRTDFKAFSGN